MERPPSTTAQEEGNFYHGLLLLCAARSMVLLSVRLPLSSLPMLQSYINQEECQLMAAYHVLHMFSIRTWQIPFTHVSRRSTPIPRYTNLVAPIRRSHQIHFFPGLWCRQTHPYRPLCQSPPLTLYPPSPPITMSVWPHPSWGPRNTVEGHTERETSLSGSRMTHTIRLK